MSLPNQPESPHSARSQTTRTATPSGSDRPALISVLSFWMISTGVPFGAPKPPAALARNPVRIRRWSAARGAPRSVWPSSQRGPATTSPDISDRSRCKVEHHLHLTADQVSERRRGPSIRYVKHFDASHHLEQLTSQVRRVADASRSHVELARISLGVTYEFGDGFDWNLGVTTATRVERVVFTTGSMSRMKL